MIVVILANRLEHDMNLGQQKTSDALPSMGSIGSKSIAAKAPRRRLDCLCVTCIVKMGPAHDDDGDKLEMTMMRMGLIVIMGLTEILGSYQSA